MKWICRVIFDLFNITQEEFQEYSCEAMKNDWMLKNFSSIFIKYQWILLKYSLEWRQVSLLIKKVLGIIIQTNFNFEFHFLLFLFRLIIFTYFYDIYAQNFFSFFRLPYLLRLTLSTSTLTWLFTHHNYSYTD